MLVGFALCVMANSSVGWYSFRGMDLDLLFELFSGGKRIFWDVKMVMRLTI